MDLYAEEIVISTIIDTLMKYVIFREHLKDKAHVYDDVFIFQRKQQSSRVGFARTEES